MAIQPCINPMCSNHLHERDVFCGACGTPANLALMPLISHKHPTVCGNCGRALRIGEDFCLTCGIGTTLVVPGNTATICTSCGYPRNQFQTTCPVCNSQVPTMPAFGVVYVPMMPSEVVSPPLIITNPTHQDIYQATIAANNPYLPHSTLISEQYSDNDLCVLHANDTDSAKSLGGRLLDHQTFADGTVQAQVRVNNEYSMKDWVTGRTGILFRVRIAKSSTRERGAGYAFYLVWKRGECTGYELRVVMLKEAEDFITTGTLITTGDLPKNVDTNHSMLLAVTMQQNTLDLYINLQHVERAYDTTFISGMSGLGAVPEGAFTSFELIATHYKVWKK